MKQAEEAGAAATAAAEAARAIVQQADEFALEVDAMLSDSRRVRRPSLIKSHSATNLGSRRPSVEPDALKGGER
jgi:hypothetical protein